MSTYDAVHAVRVEGLYANALDLDTPAVNIAQEAATPYGSGTGANQCNMVLSDSFTTASPTSLTLAAGLLDPFGTAIVFTKLRGFLIRLVTLTSGVTLAVGGDFVRSRLLASSGASTTRTVGAGGVWYDENPVDGWTVSGGANTITITPSALATFQVRLWGVV